MYCGGQELERWWGRVYIQELAEANCHIETSPFTPLSIDTRRWWLLPMEPGQPVKGLNNASSNFKGRFRDIYPRLSISAIASHSGMENSILGACLETHLGSHEGKLESTLGHKYPRSCWEGKTKPFI